MNIPVSITVNGVQHSQDVEPRMLLVHFLRDVLGLTGTNIGCDTSQCGACTVLAGAKATQSCKLPVSEVASAPITTLEGLSTAEELHPVQRAFIEEQAAQCGYCTSGMIMATAALLWGEDASYHIAQAGYSARLVRHDNSIEFVGGWPQDEGSPA